MFDTCKCFDLKFLNGRFGKDKFAGDFTCTSKSGNSVVDYIIMSSHLLPLIKDFCIDEFEPGLSDKHKTLSVKICVPINSDTHISGISNKNVTDNCSCHCSNKPATSTIIVNNDKNINSNTGTNNTDNMYTKWDKSSSTDYKSGFDTIAMTNMMDKLNDLKVEVANQDLIDEMFSEICDIFTSPALSIGVSEKRKKTFHPKFMFLYFNS